MDKSELHNCIIKMSKETAFRAILYENHFGTSIGFKVGDDHKMLVLPQVKTDNVVVPNICGHIPENFRDCLYPEPSENRKSGYIMLLLKVCNREKEP